MSQRLAVHRKDSVHPLAWWLWATGLAVAAVRTTNPFLLALIGAVACFVVASRRPDAPWSRSLSFFLKVAAAVIVIRLGVEVLFGQGRPGTVLFHLPRAPIPVGEGINIGGAVTAESLLSALYLGMQLAVIILCFGAANSMSSPYRLLRSLPAVLYEAGVVVAVALSFAPELILTIGDVHEARKLRGRPTRGPAGLRGIAVPVLEGALDRSLALAASMDARGYGRRPAVGTARRWPPWATLGGLLLVAIGTYGVLAPGSLLGLGLPAVLVGSACVMGGLLAGSRQRLRTRYRPDRWGLPEWVVAGSGLLTLTLFVVAGDIGTSGLVVGVSLAVPPLPLLPVVAAFLGLLPLAVTLPPSDRPLPTAAPVIEEPAGEPALHGAHPR
jgi:energy-coupling factor transport system permease protein